MIFGFGMLRERVQQIGPMSECTVKRILLTHGATTRLVVDGTSYGPTPEHNSTPRVRTKVVRSSGGLA